MNDTPETTPEFTVSDVRVALATLRALVANDSAQLDIELSVAGYPTTIARALFRRILETIDATELATQLAVADATEARAELARHLSAIDELAETESARQYAVADAAEARAELTRRLGVLDKHSELPAETRRGWSFAAGAALQLIASGQLPDFEPRAMLEALQLTLVEVDRLVAELGARDAFLADLETRFGVATEQIRSLQERAGVAPLDNFPREALVGDEGWPDDSDDAPHVEGDTPSGVVFDDLKAFADAPAIEASGDMLPLPGMPDVSVPRELLENGNVFVNGERVSAEPADVPQPAAD